MTMLRLMVAAYLLAVTAGVDRTMTAGADGRVVVEAVVDRIRSNCIFGDDRLFLRRLAYVETSDGEDSKTYRQGYDGGIWQIDEDKFNSIPSCNYYSQKPKCDLIQSAFNINWTTVTWSDLRKPLYSGLAASLFIQSKTYTRRDTLDNQAYFWTWYLRSGGNRSEFVQKSSNLPGSECKTELDLAFIIDGSGSVRVNDFNKTLYFIQNVVRNLPVNKDEIHVAALEYSTVVGSTITFDNYTSKDDLITAIGSIRKGNAGTNTDLAIDNTTHVIFSQAKGARPQAKKVAILLTDGKSSNTKGTLTEASEAKAAGIHLITVGVGNANRLELEAVATEPNCTNVYMLDNFQEIDSLLYELKDSSCSAATSLSTSDENTEITKSLPENSTVTETFVAPPVPGDGDGNGTTTTDGEGEQETVVKSEVTCGTLEIYASYDTPRPGPAFYDVRDTAREDNPSVIYLNDTMKGRPLYLTVIGSRLPVTTSDVISCLNASYSVSVTTQPKKAEVVCRVGDAERPCTEEDFRDSEYSGLLCDDTWSDITNPCSPGEVSVHPIPADLTKFIRCDVAGKMYVTQCPDQGTFNPNTASCSHEALEGNGNPLPSNVDSQCTATNIAAGRFHFSYPSDESKYIQCDVWGNSWVKQCPGDLEWDDDDSTCSHAADNNPCAGTTASLLPALDPTKFIQCVHGQPVQMSCPAGLVFDASISACNWQS